MFDFSINKSGELTVNSSDDVSVVDKDELIRQTAMNRIKSISNNWFNADNCANLESFIGRECNGATALEMEDAVRNALIGDGFLDTTDVFLTTKIVRTEIQIVALIRRKHGTGPMILSVQIEFAGGGTIKYETNYK